MDRNVATLIEAHNRSQFTVGDVQILRGRCELYPVAFGKLALCCAVDGDSLQAAWVIGHLLAGLTLDREQVLFSIRVCDGGIFSGLDSDDFAASRIAQHVAGVVLFCPGAVSAGEFLPGLQHAERAPFRLDCTALLHFAMNEAVQLTAGLLSGDTTNVP